MLVGEAQSGIEQRELDRRGSARPIAVVEQRPCVNVVDDVIGILRSVANDESPAGRSPSL
jgi:hypothetical protein